MATVLVALGCLMLAGCTSEADLVERLSTTEDVAVRQQAAADLAGRNSLEATELLVEAADGNRIAALGLDALAEAYGDSIAEKLQKIAESEREGTGREDGYSTGNDVGLPGLCLHRYSCG